MGRQGTGIRDVARHLRLSVSTVSRAMNNRADVSAATRTLVREASLALGYAPDQSGQERYLRRAVARHLADGFTGHLTPALTCFRVSLRDYGARLGAMIVERIKAGPSSPAIQELWAMTLSPGGSDFPLVERWRFRLRSVLAAPCSDPSVTLAHDGKAREQRRPLVNVC